ncbi:hypothetical protein [Croceimicrobium sp.]|uniref:hypothetical protein n=1 Tax=Croceimicrobium sp. TaxID=2828340 RepID=UPI003BAB4409
MKRIALFGLALLTLASCEDDPVVKTNTYPTDNLALPQVRSSLILSSYSPSFGYIAEIPRLLLSDQYGSELTFMNVVTDANSEFYSAIADSITFNQPLEAAPSFYLNDETVDMASLLTDIEPALAKKPIATVNHKVTVTDTAWVVDSKVRFWVDTMNRGFRIATYMTLSAKAANYPTAGLDLRVNAAPGTVISNGDLSVWDQNLQSLDSSGTVTTKGDPFYHSNVLVRNFNPESAWGFSFEEYSPFGQSFSKGDIIGTKTTPIRHYFPTPNSGLDGAIDVDFEFTPGFLTVIWCENSETAKYEYINSVFTALK